MHETDLVHRGVRWQYLPAFFLQERIFLTLSNYIFTAVFLAEMTVKVMWGGGGGQHWMEAIWFPAAGGGAGEGWATEGRQGWGLLQGRRQCW